MGTYLSLTSRLSLIFSMTMLAIWIDLADRWHVAKIDDNFELKLIQTVRGMGYTLDVPL